MTSALNNFYFYITLSSIMLKYSYQVSTFSLVSNISGPRKFFEQPMDFGKSLSFKKTQTLLQGWESNESSINAVTLFWSDFNLTNAKNRKRLFLTGLSLAT